MSPGRGTNGWRAAAASAPTLPPLRLRACRRGARGRRDRKRSASAPTRKTRGLAWRPPLTTARTTGAIGDAVRSCGRHADGPGRAASGGRDHAQLRRLPGAGEATGVIGDGCSRSGRERARGGVPELPALWPEPQTEAQLVGDRALPAMHGAWAGPDHAVLLSTADNRALPRGLRAESAEPGDRPGITGRQRTAGISDGAGPTACASVPRAVPSTRAK